MPQGAGVSSSYWKVGLLVRVMLGLRTVVPTRGDHVHTKHGGDLRTPLELDSGAIRVLGDLSQVRVLTLERVQIPFEVRAELLDGNGLRLDLVTLQVELDAAYERGPGVLLRGRELDRFARNTLRNRNHCSLQMSRNTREQAKHNIT